MSPPFFSRKKSPTREAQKSSAPLARSTETDALAEEADLPPVVARMIVEIRSDGTRTIARGALEDLQTGERVSMQANAASPLALAKELSQSILKTPSLAKLLAKQKVKDLLPNALRRKLSARRKPKR